MSIILGSQSKRRKLILEFFNLPFTQIPSLFDEKTLPPEKDPKKYVEALAEKKAREIALRYPQEIILTADTVVYFKNSYLHKPADETEAFSMLKKLSASWHQVFTGVCVFQKGQAFSGSEESQVLFNPLTDGQIQKYHRHFYFSDKAGGYAIQEGGSIIVQKISGCFYNVMGLPINTVRGLLLKVGLDLWDFLK
ncbi:MAG: Maf family nucleotide pyrophosphatase [Parachlamydiales bacterium]|jgi:septum formation protein